MNVKSQPSLSRKLSTGATSNQVRSNCKLCPAPVLVGEAAEFIADPVGLSHTPCIEAHRQSRAATAGGGR